MGHRLRTFACILLPVLPALLLPACQDGHITALGYSTQPNFDPNIKTVHVNIFENRTFHRGLEFELQTALTRDIEQMTPYKVVGAGCKADTELTGVITGYNKNVLNRTQQNEIREAETVLTVEITWTDLRSGEVLSSPTRGANPPIMPTIQPAIGATPAAAQPIPPVETLPSPTPVGPPPPPQPKPVIVQSRAQVIPELGVSNLAARKVNADRLAVQIVSMMEAPWGVPCR